MIRSIIFDLGGVLVPEREGSIEDGVCRFIDYDRRDEILAQF